MNHLTAKTTIPAFILLGLGVYLLKLPIIGHASLFVASILAYYIIFGMDGLDSLFIKPERPILNTVRPFVSNWIWSIAMGMILTVGLGFHLKSNGATGDLSVLPFVPMMIMGEELFSITILNTMRIHFPTWVSSLITAVVFGLVHFSTYYNGNIIQALIQVLMIQGVARLIFNQSYLASDSLWTSFTAHLAFDLVGLFLFM